MKSPEKLSLDVDKHGNPFLTIQARLKPVFLFEVLEYQVRSDDPTEISFIMRCGEEICLGRERMKQIKGLPRRRQREEVRGLVQEVRGARIITIKVANAR